MTTKEINQSMECIYDRPYVTAASVSKMEDRDWFFFQVTVDLGALDDGNGMSTIMSKKYDTYDDAVIAMNEHLEGVYSPV
jgi:hypothetical protein